MYFAFVMEPNDRDLVLPMVSNLKIWKTNQGWFKNVFDLIFFVNLSFKELFIIEHQWQIGYIILRIIYCLTLVHV
jgi:hypothetical protein